MAIDLFALLALTPQTGRLRILLSAAASDEDAEKACRSWLLTSELLFPAHQLKFSAPGETALLTLIKAGDMAPFVLEIEDGLAGFLGTLLSTGGAPLHATVDFERKVIQIAGQTVPGQRLYIQTGSTMKEVERLMLFHALEVTNGNKAAAARLLGISRRTLYNRLAQHSPTQQ